MRKRLERFLDRATAALAAAGALLLLAVALVTLYSIVGRAHPDLPWLAWWKPLRGSFELVELATGVAVFSFLPLTQHRRGNVAVEMVDFRRRPWINLALSALGNLLLLTFVILLTWRMALGSLDLLLADYVRTTFLLGVPITWAYVPATFLSFVLSVVTLHSLWRDVEEMTLRRNSTGTKGSGHSDATGRGGP